MKLTDLRPLSDAEYDLYMADLEEHRLIKEDWSNWYESNICDMECEYCKYDDVCEVRVLHDL